MNHAFVPVVTWGSPSEMSSPLPAHLCLGHYKVDNATVMSAYARYEMEAPEPWVSVELPSRHRSCPPDCKFLCSVCYGVLKRPVSLPCSYIFCKKCTLQWLARQDICPCCRKEVKRKKMVHVNKLWKTIDHPEVMCKNAEAGCSVTCPLVHRKKHQDSSPFELMACPNEGCSAWVFHGALAEHQQHCQQAGRQHCPLGCGATLGTAELAHYHCDLKLPEAWSERQEHSQMLLQGLQGRVHRVHHAGSWPSSATSWKMMPRM